MTNAQMNGTDEGVESEVGTIGDLLNGSTALEAVDRASIDMQIATAKRYPRSVDKSLKEALTLATLDEETAASMFYALPRGRKRITGPSARLAEVMAYSWGNLRVDADIVAEDRTHVTAMGTCFDLEKNVAVRVRVKRRITNSRGQRYDTDMIGVTSNAAISIALRNAVFKVVPRAFADRIFEEAKQASIGKAGTITEKRQNAMSWFERAGATAEQVFEVLGVRGIDDIGTEELITLRGLKTAIRDGEANIEQVFARTESEAAGGLDEAVKQAGADEGTSQESQDPIPATDTDRADLTALVEKARAANAMDSGLEELAAAGLAEGATKDDVATAKRKVSVALARAAGTAEAEQDGLGLEG